ncbi:MAG: AAA family ATPase [Thermodesulfobacteriota bacterium]
MKINKISLYNFRQFYGNQYIELTTNKDKNVTLIHAENGVGKTTILNSVLWCFFNLVTSKFEQKEKIINFEAIAEGKKDASVSVDFEHEGTFYNAQRHFVEGKKENPSDFSVLKISNSISTPLNAPVSFINSVIPKEMAKYFFFDGEAAERFSAEKNYKLIGKAIRNMLGCELAETAMSDLKFIVGKLDSKIGSCADDEQIKNKEKELDELKTKLDKYKAKKDETEEEIETQVKLKNEINKKLEKNIRAKEIHSQRLSKEDEYKEKLADIKEGELNLIKWISAYATSIVSKKLSQITLDFINEEEIKGRIPSPYDEKFVEDILSAQICICGRRIEPESQEWRSVTALLNKASSANLLSKVTRSRATIQYLQKKAGDAPSAFEDLQKRIARDHDQLSKLEQKIQELKSQITNLNIQEINEQEKARDNIEKELSKLQITIGNCDTIIKQTEKRIPSVEKELAVLASQSQKVRKIFIRRQLAQTAFLMLEIILKDYEVSAREEISKLVNIMLEETARKDYSFRFNNDFSIELLYSDSMLPVPKSDGENQILSLMFLSSLIKYSQSLIDLESQIIRPGTIAPLILDSPYGQLDKKYKASIAKQIPQMASQIVMLVSSSQGDETVLDAIRPFIGAEYILIAENKGSRRDKKSSDTIFLNGKSYDRLFYNCEKNLSRIERIL